MKIQQTKSGVLYVTIARAYARAVGIASGDTVIWGITKDGLVLTKVADTRPSEVACDEL